LSADKLDPLEALVTMKIVDVELIQLVKEYEHPHRNSKQAATKRITSLVRLTTDEGIDGLGEVFCDPALAKSAVLSRLRPELLGEDPFNVESIWNRAFHGAAMYNATGAFVAGISGIDLACWDIMGKALGQPVYNLIGGLCQSEILAYASDLHWEEDPLVMARAAESFAERGFRSVKTHLGIDAIDDIRRVAALREAIGPDVGLMVDINTAFDRPTAIRFGQRIAQYDIAWYEEPLSPLDIDGLEIVRAATGLPIAVGENLYTRWGFKEVFQRGGIDVAMPDLARTGGISETKKIAAIADAFGVVVSPHNYASGVCSAATFHLLAASPRPGLLEWDTAGSSIVDELFIEPPVMKDGSIEVPKLPGLGVHLTDEVRAHYEA
jgi:D-galactarolactone cycloisomerase